MTFRHRAGVSPYTSPFGFAETCVFAKQSLGPILCGPPLGGPPFSLSYGVILPSSLTTLLPPACGFSPRPPVSVCGTGAHAAIAAFLGSVGSPASLLFFAPHKAPPSRGGFSSPARLGPWPGFPIPRPGYPPASPHVLGMRGAGISTSCPSATAFALALGPDLPWADQLDPGNLGLPAYMILAYISLLIPAFSPPQGPPTLSR